MESTNNLCKEFNEYALFLKRNVETTIFEQSTEKDGTTSLSYGVYKPRGFDFIDHAKCSHKKGSNIALLTITTRNEPSYGNFTQTFKATKIAVNQETGLCEATLLKTSEEAPAKIEKFNMPKSPTYQQEADRRASRRENCPVL